MTKFTDVQQALEAIVAPGRDIYPSSFTIGYVNHLIAFSKTLTTGIQEKEFVEMVRIQSLRATSALPNQLTQDQTDYVKLEVLCLDYLSQ